MDVFLLSVLATIVSLLMKKFRQYSEIILYIIWNVVCISTHSVEMNMIITFKGCGSGIFVCLYWKWQDYLCLLVVYLFWSMWVYVHQLHLANKWVPAQQIVMERKLIYLHFMKQCMYIIYCNTVYIIMYKLFSIIAVNLYQMISMTMCLHVATRSVMNTKMLL